MRSIILISSALLLSLNLQAGNRLYKSLNRLYKTEPTECLIRSKKLMDRRPNRAESYFFACQIYIDKTNSKDNAQAKFFRTRSAIRYAQDFQDISDEELRILVDWDSKFEELKLVVSDVFILLEKNNHTEMSEALAKKWKKLAKSRPFDAEFEKIIIEADGQEVVANELQDNNEVVIEIDAEESGIIPESEIVGSEMISGSLMGMPSGNENVVSYNYAHEIDLLDLINRERLSQGLNQLEWNDDLARASRYHGFDMGSQSYFDHMTYDRKGDKLTKVGWTFDRIEAFYDDSHVNGENIAAGHESPEEIFNQWMTSSGHKETMMRPDSKLAGIGVVRVPGSPFQYYWVLCTAE